MEDSASVQPGHIRSEAARLAMGHCGSARSAPVRLGLGCRRPADRGAPLPLPVLTSTLGAAVHGLPRRVSSRQTGLRVRRRRSTSSPAAGESPFNTPATVPAHGPAPRRRQPATVTGGKVRKEPGKGPAA